MHPPGDETQWDWVDLPDPPAAWGVGQEGAPAGRGAGAFGQVAGWLSPSMDQPHLVDALDQVDRGLWAG